MLMIVYLSDLAKSENDPYMFVIVFI